MRYDPSLQVIARRCPSSSAISLTPALRPSVGSYAATLECRWLDTAFPREGWTLRSGAAADMRRYKGGHRATRREPGRRAGRGKAASAEVNDRDRLTEGQQRSDNLPTLQGTLCVHIAGHKRLLQNPGRGGFRAPGVQEWSAGGNVHTRSGPCFTPAGRSWAPAADTRPVGVLQGPLRESETSEIPYCIPSSRHLSPRLNQAILGIMHYARGCLQALRENLPQSWAYSGTSALSNAVVDRKSETRNPKSEKTHS